MGSAPISTIETLPSRYSPTSGARKSNPTAGATRRSSVGGCRSGTRLPGGDAVGALLRVRTAASFWMGVGMATG
jgi:hypothetical protein